MPGRLGTFFRNFRSVRMGLSIRSISRDMIILRGMVTRFPKPEAVRRISILLFARVVRGRRRGDGFGSLAFLTPASVTLKDLEASSKLKVSSDGNRISDVDHSSQLWSRIIAYAVPLGPSTRNSSM